VPLLALPSSVQCSGKCVHQSRNKSPGLACDAMLMRPLLDESNHGTRCTLLSRQAVDCEWLGARFDWLDPPQQDAGLPRIDSLPAEWLSDPG
jgi:hypothetical protein